MSDTHPRDEALFVRYCESGDPGAFASLYDRYGAAIHGFLRRFVGGAAAAEDLAQHTFLRIHEARDAFDARRSFRIWAFTIARRVAFNWLERHRTSGGEERVPDLVHPGPSPEERTIARDEMRAVERALASLDSRDVEVILLAKHEGLSYQEIGAITGCSADAAKMRVHRALRRLAKRLPAPTS